jgi:2-oxoacid:acceptor oxidoreductase gamma subunit (pyruvate/2-ketoisovalerate family)
MFRIRFHGRGGQGVKTASQILGTAFFREGYEVQDAPRYGAERRGAPIFAYVRAARASIAERGVITRPDLVIVAGISLFEAVLAFFQFPGSGIGLAMSIMPIIILLYLNSASVKAAFGVTEPPPAA